MAYNKNNYENNRLTAKQEKFCQEIVKGKNQYQAMITAYPSRAKWDRNAVDSTASQLMQNPKVIQRLNQLRSKDEKKTIWTRQKILNEIEEVMNLHKEDMIRINETTDEEIEQKLQELQEWTSLLVVPNVDTKGVKKQIDRITKEIQNIKLRRKANAVNTNGIYNGLKIINRMMGYDITKVEIQAEDEERENMKSLSVEELKAIAYANIDKEGE